MFHTKIETPSSAYWVGRIGNKEIRVKLRSETTPTMATSSDPKHYVMSADSSYGYDLIPLGVVARCDKKLWNRHVALIAQRYGDSPQMDEFWRVRSGMTGGPTATHGDTDAFRDSAIRKETLIATPPPNRGAGAGPDQQWPYYWIPFYQRM